ncbi:MAG: S-layer homology domain-containing protein [Armatimonadetes bacterium]|nr:S-layer homology domain-containing protein [Armatimonadota bacterium]
MRVLRGWLVVLVWLAAAGPGAVRAAAEPFDPVPAGHWSYAAVQQLAAAGYFTGYPESTFEGERALTRYDFAVAVDRLLHEAERQVMALVSSPGDTPPRSGAELRRDLAAIQRLAGEYAAELGMTGMDLAQVHQHTRALLERLDRFARLPAAAAEHASSPAGSPVSERGIAPWQGGLPGLRGLAPNLQARIQSVAEPGLSDLPAGDSLLTAEVLAPDPLHLGATRPLLEPADARLALMARLNVPLSRRLGISGYYRRVGEGYLPPDSGLSFHALTALRGLEGFGGALFAPITDRLAVNLEGAIYHDPDRKSIGSARYFRGGVNVALSDRLFLDLAYERLISAGGGQEGTDNVYQIGVQRLLGRNVSFGLLYQIHQSRHGRDGLSNGPTSLLDLDQHSAMTRFTVRF